MNFKKVNNISGWVIFLIALATYVLSMEPTASLWDCGEFILTAYKLQVAHAPGAPLFMMLGRIFSLFASDTTMVAASINFMSATASAFTILFLYWSITHFARKIVLKNNTTEELSQANIFTILGAGTVGALAYTFSDTFWFSAVEGEVYAMSSFFTAIVFWAALKWEDQSQDPKSDRWMILIFYLMGLSIGVHLLNLLTIPAIIMVYYFKRYQYSMKGSIYAFIVGIIALAIVQFGVIQFLPIFAAQFELLFVNSFHLPFNSGLFFFIALLIAIIVFVLRFAKKKGKVMLHTCMLALSFVIIGYSSFVAVVLRSKADVPIDMGNPDNVISLIPYLQRDQYGSQPIVTGPYFDSKLVEIKKDRSYYAALQDEQGRDYYKQISFKPKYVFDKNYFFPRIWSSQDGHSNFYRGYLGLGKSEQPSGVDNFKFFFGYQLNWMYWRYFMWNYVGRQNDIEGQGEAQNGNWISGIKFVDKMFGKGDADLMPDDLKNNKARNEYYFLPFILGIVGLVYHYKKEKHDFIVVGLFFFFTGIAIQMYINNTPLQPRERDYAYVSTYAFAMWIGLGILAITELLNKKMKSSGIAAPAIATIVCLVAVPGLMLAENWDDHDRSEKTIAKDHARNMLASLDSNAILITYGDNDTYPLWYLQEIEGFRRDVRIVNVNLLGTDWQNDQLTYKVNQSDAVPMIWNKGDYLGSKLEYSYIVEDPRVDKNAYFKIDDIIKYVSNPKNHQNRQGDSISIIPTRNFLMKIDRNAVIKSGLVKQEQFDLIPEEIAFQVQKNGMTRGDLSILNMLAGQMNTGFTRPIYMCEGVENFGLEEYFKNEGPVRKFVPVRSTLNVQGLTDYTNADDNIRIFNEFEFGGANTDKIYYDEKNKLIFLTYRQKVAQFASYLSIVGRQKDAKAVLDNFMSKVSETSLPYSINNLDRGSILQVIEAYYRANDAASAAKYGDRFLENIMANVRYFKDLGSKLNDNSQNNTMLNHNMQMANYLLQVGAQYGDQANVQKWAQIAGVQAPATQANPAIQSQTEVAPKQQAPSESDSTQP